MSDQTIDQLVKTFERRAHRLISPGEVAALDQLCAMSADAEECYKANDHIGADFFAKQFYAYAKANPCAHNVQHVLFVMEDE